MSRGGLLILLTGLFLSSCILTQKSGRITREALDELSRTRAIKKGSKEATEGILEAVMTDTSRIRALVRGILKEVTRESGKMTAAVRDSLLNAETALWLDDRLDAVSESTRTAIMQIVNDEQLRAGSRKIVATLRDELLSYATVQKLVVMRDSLMGRRTNALVDSLISSAIRQMAVDYDKSLKKPLYELLDRTGELGSKKLDEVNKTVQYLIGLLGLVVLAAIIVGIVIYRIQKKKKEVEEESRKTSLALHAVTSTIDDLPESTYQKVAPKVKDRADAAGINTHLNKKLDEFRLRKRESFKNSQRVAIEALLERMKNEPELREKVTEAMRGNQVAEKFFKDKVQDKNQPE